MGALAVLREQLALILEAFSSLKGSMIPFQSGVLLTLTKISEGFHNTESTQYFILGTYCVWGPKKRHIPKAVHKIQNNTCFEYIPKISLFSGTEVDVTTIPTQEASAWTKFNQIP